MIPKTTFIKKKTLSEDFRLRNDKNVKGIMTPNSHETAENLYTKHSNVHRLPPPQRARTATAPGFGAYGFQKRARTEEQHPGLGPPEPRNDFGELADGFPGHLHLQRVIAQFSGPG